MLVFIVLPCLVFNAYTFLCVVLIPALIPIHSFKLSIVSLFITYLKIPTNYKIPTYYKLVS